MSLFKSNYILGSAFETTQRYCDLIPIGSGVSGLVCCAKDLLTNNLVAIKKLSGPFQSPENTKLIFREIRLLRHLNHENVVDLTDLFISPSEDIYVCTEYMRLDLATLLKARPIEEKFAQFFLYQMMRGLKYIHSAGVVHRDLKPSNILIEENCDLKIRDFGLSHVQEMCMTGYVSTRYYRAPEVMLSWEHYNEKIDIWSAGCIFAEMLLGRPLFPGQNHTHHFTLITELRGKPPEHALKNIRDKNTLGFMKGLPGHKPKPMAQVIPRTVDPKASELLEKILVYDFDKRPSALDTLESPYLAQYHDPSDEPSADQTLDWSFLKENLPPHIWKLRTYSEVLKYHGRYEPPQAAEKLSQFVAMDVS